jgi:hypothetical protein
MVSFIQQYVHGMLRVPVWQLSLSECWNTVNSVIFGALIHVEMKHKDVCPH